MSQKLPTDKCEKTILPKEAFHKESFRWTHQGRVHLLVGCPKVLDRGGKNVKTVWDASRKAGSQCRVASSGAKAGTRVHNIVVPSEGGRCKARYKHR